jgi:hypothetical protein
MINTSDMYKITSCTCSREKAPLYYYCDQEIHPKNFTQPNSLIMNDVYSLADQINALTDNITSFSIASTRTRLCNQLQQWRDKSINIIKNIYKQKQSELNAKICRLDAAVNQIKAEKQREISQIKMKITELINCGQAATEQVNSLRKLVDQAAFDVDKLRSSTIRIETQPANMDTCRIVYMDPAPHIKSEDSTASTYKIGINNKVRNYNKATNRFRSTTNKSKSTMHKNRPVPPISLSSLLRKSHLPPTLLPHIPKSSHIPMPPPIHEPSPISKASHIPMPPPIPEPPPTSRASYIPMPPSIPEPSTTSKTSHIPTPPSIPEPPPTSRSSYIPMPSAIPELPPKSISSHMPMSRSMPELPPIFNSSHIPIAPDISKLFPISKPPDILARPPICKPSTIFKPPDILVPPPMHKLSPVFVLPPLPQVNLNKIRKKIRFIID